MHLRDLWPTREEIDARAGARPPTRPTSAAPSRSPARNPLWHALEAPDSAALPVGPGTPRRCAARRSPRSTEGTPARPLQRPIRCWCVGDDITTDHISPASAIPPDSLVADFLVERGDDRNDLNVFASRRGNWEVMLRAAFHSKTLVQPARARRAGGAHAARAQRRRACRSGRSARALPRRRRCRWCWWPASATAPARRATGPPRASACSASAPCWPSSFERIHRSNLVGMGILPLRLPQGVSPQTLAAAPRRPHRGRRAAAGAVAALRRAGARAARRRRRSKRSPPSPPSRRSSRWNCCATAASSRRS